MEINWDVIPLENWTEEFLKLSIMEIKKAVFKTKMIEQKIMVSDAVYGCDQCKKEIQVHNDPTVLEIAIFHNTKESERKQFCSWKCVFKFIPKVKSDYFLSLPFVHFDQKTRGIDELLKFLKK